MAVNNAPEFWQCCREKEARSEAQMRKRGRRWRGGFV